MVHEFVQNEGLDCLIKLGRESDQTHQNHILRAIGQLMLYVDGMNGIIGHSATICWLYELLESPVSSLKLLATIVLCKSILTVNSFMYKFECPYLFRFIACRLCFVEVIVLVFCLLHLKIFFLLIRLILCCLFLALRPS